MKKQLAWVLAAVGWILFIGYLVIERQRTELVRSWAAGAYELGYHDGKQAASVETKNANRKRMAESVVKAHNGGW